MIKHIVMLKLKEEEPESQLSILKDKIDQLKNKIPEIREFETGINLSESPSAYDIVLVSTFENEADLNIYRNHPDHKVVMILIKEIITELAVVDYKI